MSTLKSLTKVELIALIKSRDAEIEALRLALSKAAPIKAARAPAETRYWDEFPHRNDAMAWARANGGVVKSRPAQRAGS